MHRDEPGPAKRRLGRGLNALLGQGAGPESTPGEGSDAELQRIEVGRIDRNPFQPRKDFEAESLKELVASIRQHGVLQQHSDTCRLDPSAAEAAT